MTTNAPSAADPASDALQAQVGRPYRDAVRSLWPDVGIWDYLRYDDAGDLWLGPLRLIDAVRAYGTPLEVVDTVVLERRAREWSALAERTAAAAGYPGRLGFLYAAKANMASEITHAAYRAGWHAETSSQQDLAHLMWLAERQLLPAGLRVVCNGFKLPPEAFGRDALGACDPAGLPPAHPRSLLLPPAPPEHLDPAVRDRPYAETIVHLARAGWAITPILDEGEVAWFAARGQPPMAVGLRMKHGQVATDHEHAALVSRFGFDREGLFAAAEAVAAAPHLALTTLHAMVGAAETIPVERMVASLRYAGAVWADLRTRHPELRELNMGGGVPPLGEPYDHAGFLRGLYAALAEEAAARAVPPPDLTFEFGSLVAAESAMHVFRVVQRKVNHIAAAGEPGGALPWAILDGGLMAAIPDMLLIDRAFRFLALTGANRPALAVRFGDLTCDSDGRYPPASFGPGAAVLLPDAAPLHVAVMGVGAYQEILAGVRGAHHCGLLEAVELILEPGPDGPLARVIARQTKAEAMAVLGYTDDAAAALARAALARST